jgi:hypothetical protein
MANTHYAHVLAKTGGAGTEEDPQRYISLDGMLTEEGAKIEDITATESALYVDPEPNLIVVKVTASEAVLDAIAASADNEEIFREALPQEVV